MKLLVIGGSGLLGTYFGFNAKMKNWEATSLSRNVPRAFERWSRMTEANDLQTIIESHEFDLVINTSAVTSLELCEENPSLALQVNAIWPEVWALACGRNNIPFIHISTDAVFSGDGSNPYREDDPPSPGSMYGLTKRMGEVLVLSANSSATVVRTNFFGWSPDGKYGILDFFFRSLSKQQPTIGFNDYFTSSIYASHLVDVILELFTSGVEGLIHVASSDWMSKFEFGKTVAEVFDLKANLLSSGSKDVGLPSARRGSFLALETERASSVLDRRLPTGYEGLELAKSERILFAGAIRNTQVGSSNENSR